MNPYINLVKKAWFDILENTMNHHGFEIVKEHGKETYVLRHRSVHNRNETSAHSTFFEQMPRLISEKRYSDSITEALTNIYIENKSVNTSKYNEMSKEDFLSYKEAIITDREHSFSIDKGALASPTGMLFYEINLLMVTPLLNTLDNLPIPFNEKIQTIKDMHLESIFFERYNECFIPKTFKDVELEILSLNPKNPEINQFFKEISFFAILDSFPQQPPPRVQMANAFENNLQTSLAIYDDVRKNLLTVLEDKLKDENPNIILKNYTLLSHVPNYLSERSNQIAIALKLNTLTPKELTSFLTNSKTSNHISHIAFLENDIHKLALELQEEQLKKLEYFENFNATTSNNKHKTPKH